MGRERIPKSMLDVLGERSHETTRWRQHPRTGESLWLMNKGADGI